MGIRFGHKQSVYGSEGDNQGRNNVYNPLPKGNGGPKMKRFKAVLIVNAALYLAEAIALVVWRVCWPFSWYCYWTARLNLNF